MKKNDELHLTFSEASPPTEVHTAKSWRGVSVQYSRLHLPAEYEFRWEGESHYLAHHDLVLLDGEMEVSGERPVAATDLRDLMTYVPKGQTIEGWAKPVDRLNAFTVVCFDPAVMEEELQAEFARLELRANIYFQDRELGSTMRKLGHIMADHERPSSKVYSETVGLTAALEMVRLGAQNPAKVGGSGQLGQTQCRLLTDYVEANLSSDIGLDDLAAITGLTRFHFSRAFKATFGEPPYQFVIRKRVERAQTMLTTTRLSIADIATACGFGSASQMGRSFRDVVGQTPLAFRRSA